MTATKHRLHGIGIGIAALCVGACSSGGGGAAPMGELSLAITDASVDSVEAIVVRFTGVRLKPQSGPAIDIPFLDENGEPVVRDIDMLTLTNGNYETLFGATKVPAGPYNWMELQVLAELDGSTEDSHVVTNGGLQHELRVPSGSETGLRLVSGFTVTADQVTQLMIDWDMRMALIEPPSIGDAYMVRPAFRVIDMTEYGTLSGVVAPELYDAAGCPSTSIENDGNAVYVYRDADLGAAVPDDLGGSGVTPVATATVRFDSNSQYSYSLILSPDSYRVAYTCEAELDSLEVDDDIELLLDEGVVTIENGETWTVDFPALP